MGCNQRSGSRRLGVETSLWNCHRPLTRTPPTIYPPPTPPPIKLRAPPRTSWPIADLPVWGERRYRVLERHICSFKPTQLMSMVCLETSFHPGFTWELGYIRTVRLPTLVPHQVLRVWSQVTKTAKEWRKDEWENQFSYGQFYSNVLRVP